MSAGSRTHIEAIRAEAARREWTQVDLAERSGIAQTSISRIFNGKQGLTRKVALRVYAAFEEDRPGEFNGPDIDLLDKVEDGERLTAAARGSRHRHHWEPIPVTEPLLVRCNCGLSHLIKSSSEDMPGRGHEHEWTVLFGPKGVAGPPLALACRCGQFERLEA